MARNPDATVHSGKPRKGQTFAVGDYEVESKPLGQGGMATVYRAFGEDGRAVALKELQPHLARDREMTKRFRQEYDVVAKLRHDHVVRFLDYVRANQTYYIVMEFVDGVSLRQVLAKRPKRLPLPLALGLGHVLARTVEHIHGAGVLHRDLKPGNVLFGRDGAIKVTDFGIAYREGTRLTATGVVLGSPTYMAPEQLSGDREAIGEHTDVYALGTLIYESIEGVDPYRVKPKEDLLAVLHRKAEAEPKEMKHCDIEALSTLLLRCVSPQREDRPQGMGELSRALALMAQEHGAPTGQALGQAILAEVGLDEAGLAEAERVKRERAAARKQAKEGASKTGATVVGTEAKKPSNREGRGGRRAAILGSIAIAALLGLLTFLLSRGCFG